MRQANHMAEHANGSGHATPAACRMKGMQACAR